MTEQRPDYAGPTPQGPTSAPLTDERLAEIRARVEAATPGLWRASRVVELGQEDGPDPWTLDGPEWIECDEEWMYFCEANAEFIAHAHQDVPDLLAEIDRLRAELVAVREAKGVEVEV